MPDLAPFRGLLYDSTVPLDQVIAPPYDVIDPQQRQELAERHPNNAVSVELPEAQGDQDPYHHAAAMLEAWRRRAILRTDPEPCFYVYRMTTPQGFATTGVVGALGLPDAHSDEVRPHEETLAKPLGDRLELLRATRCNTSPIWLLSMAQGLSSHLPTTGEPAARATDDQGVDHALWRLEDAGAQRRITEVVSSAPLVVADGHHRYQTALHYRQERATAASERPRDAEGEEPEGDDAGARAVMAYVVELSDEQLQVGAIHRVLTGHFDGEAALEAAKAHFDAVRAGSLSPGVIKALESSGNLALLTPHDAWLLSMRQAPDDDLLDPDVIQPVLRDLPHAEVSFAHSAEKAADYVRSGQAQAALLLRPVGVERIARWAAAGQRMPPKTTYFHPKPQTGMVFRNLDA